MLGTARPNDLDTQGLPSGWVIEIHYGREQPYTVRDRGQTWWFCATDFEARERIRLEEERRTKNGAYLQEVTV